MSADAGRSPLQEIEHDVQVKAKALDIDPTTDGGDRELRRLIEETVARWSEDHQRGHRAHDLHNPGSVVERAHRNLARYGPLTSLLEDDDVWEIMVNGPDGAFDEYQ